MNVLQQTTIACPYCGEKNTILLDLSVEQQQYIEDCQVCCRPMDILVNTTENGGFQLDVRSEND